MLAMEFLNNFVFGFIDDSLDGKNFPFQELNIRYIGMTHEIWLSLLLDGQRRFILNGLLFYFYLYFRFKTRGWVFLGRDRI